MPPEIMGSQPPTLFQLDEKQFGRNKAKPCSSSKWVRIWPEFTCLRLRCQWGHSTKHLGGPCWKDWHRLTEVQPPFTSCACSTVPLPVFVGWRQQCDTHNPKGEGDKGTQWCHCCSHWGSMGQLKQHTGIWGRESFSSRFTMTSWWWQPQTVLVQFMLPCRTLCCVPQGSGSMLARPRCGTRQACAPRFATF